MLTLRSLQPIWKAILKGQMQNVLAKGKTYQVLEPNSSDTIIPLSIGMVRNTNP